MLLNTSIVRRNGVVIALAVFFMGAMVLCAWRFSMCTADI